MLLIIFRYSRYLSRRLRIGTTVCAQLLHRIPWLSFFKSIQSVNKMKAIIVCLVAILALGALVHGHNEAKLGKLLRRELELPDLLRPRRICEPGSTKAVECNHCFCMPDGSGWGCTQMGCATYQLTVSDLADPAPEA